MSNLARRSNSGSAGTKVLLVRQPIHSVRAAHDASALPLQLAIGVIISLGVLLALWLMGLLGFRLGFAPLIGVPSLQQSGSESIIVAVRALLSIPMTIVRSGISQPLWLMLGFVAIAIPAASLGAVRPPSPGGPRPHVLTVTFSYASAIAAAVFALLILGWIASPMRSNLMQPLPAAPQQITTWLRDLQLAAGLDVMGLVAMSLWVVLVMRITVPRWLRGLVASVCFTVLGISFAAASVSSVIVSQCTAERTVAAVLEGATSEQVLVLGEAYDQLGTLRAGPSHVAIDLIEHPHRLRVVNQRSIVQFIADQVEP